MTLVSKLIYESISRKCSTAYIFSGGSIMKLIDHFHPSNNYNKMKYFIPSNEASSGFCSIGHNKSLNKLDSVIITTSGPGLTNVITPLTDANRDNVPLLVISGDVSTSMMGRHAFQEAPVMELTKPITYWNYTILDPDETEDVMEYAFTLTNQSKQVHINIPKDILNTYSQSKKKINISHKLNKLIDINDNIFFNNNLSDYYDQFDNNIIDIANIINKSKKPVLYVGRGCNEAYIQLRELSNKASIPVTTTLHGLGIINEHNDLSLKMVGMHGSERANVAIQNSDCIICVGARFDDRTIGNVDKYAPNAKHIIHINNDLDSFNKVIQKTINVYGDSKLLLLELNKYIYHKSNNDWYNFLCSYSKDFPYNNNELKQQDILIMLDKELEYVKNKLIITTGVGNHQMYSAQLLTHIYPNRFITSGSLGTMGSSNSMAIGAKLANPDKIVISIDGDQSFNMMHDLNMIQNYNIPLKIIIMNDGKQSMVNVWEKIFFNNNITATEIVNPNYKYLSLAYNIKYLEINNTYSQNEIKHILKKFIKETKPVILNCVVASDFCLPLVPPGNGLDEMITINNVETYIINKNNIPS